MSSKIDMKIEYALQYVTNDEVKYIFEILAILERYFQIGHMTNIIMFPTK